MRVLRPREGGEVGGVTVRKSLRKWMTYGSLKMFTRIQQSASDKELNILGLLLHLKDRLTAVVGTLP